MSDPIAPLDAFAEHSLDEWRAAVPAHLGHRDRDGIFIQPLYTAADLPDALPNERPAPEWEIWERGEEWPDKDRPLHLSTLPYHNAGANVVDELACLLAIGADALRSARKNGIDAEQFSMQCILRVAVGGDVFREIAKLRAVREIWRRLTNAEAFVHAVCSERTLTRVDAWTNLMRVTTQAFAAASAGVDAITPNAYDDAGAEPGELGRRIARNTLLILRHESGLGGGLDPAHGSYYLEALTREIADAAWKRYETNDLDSLRRSIRREWNEVVLPAIRTLRQPITGVSAYPSTEPPLTRRFTAQRFDADPFEDLRDRVAALPRTPTVSIRKFGSPREHGAAFQFAQNLFLAGGFRIVEGEAPIVCVCGPAPEFDGAIVAEDLMAREFDAVGLLEALLDQA